MDVNWLDILILLPLLVGLVRGMIRGLVSEAIAIAVVVLGAASSHFGAALFSRWIHKQFAWPVEVCDVVAYVLIFITVAIVLALVAKLLSKFLKKIHLGWANRLLGGVFGMCKFAIIVLIVVFVMDKTNRRFHWLDKAQVVKTSLVYPYAVEAVRYMEDIR